MQFTGLLDKNGKEIYDGDIRKETWYFTSEPRNGTQIMQWNENQACFEWEGDNIPPFLGIEIIGNIYENPELINKLDL